jgi:predicted small lipoprotein YifL
MKNALKLTALVLCCVALVACSQKGPAEAALAAATAAVDGVKADATQYVPDQAKSLTASLTSAREAFDKGDYKAALETANAIPAKAKDVATAAAAKKDELAKSWAALAASVPPMIEELKAKLDAIAAMKKLPKGFDKAKLEADQATLADVQKGANEAAEAGKAGNFADAVAKGTAVKTKAEALMADLAAAPAAPAAAPAAAPKKKK